MPKSKRKGVSVSDIVSEPVIKEPKAPKTPKVAAKAVDPATADLAAPAKPVTRNDELAIDALINLVVVYTPYTKVQARHLITGVIARERHLLVNDVLEWCTYLKELETQQKIVTEVANGNALVEKIDGKWTLLDRVTT